MRVAFFVNVFPPRHESFILNQAIGLLERGVDVEIIARRKGRETSLVNGAGKDLGRLARYCPVVPTNRLARYFHGIGWAAGNLKLATALGKQSLMQKQSRKPGPLRLLGDSLPFREKRDYDVVHCQYGPLGASAVKLREAGLFDAPIVTAFRGTDLTRETKQHPAVYSHLFEEGDLFLPVSEDFQQRLIDLGCPANKIQVLRSGIATAQFAYRARSVSADGTLNLLSVGRLVEKKGFEYAIRAVAKLGAIKGVRNQLPERPSGCFAQLVPDPFNCPAPLCVPLSYTIVGDGPLKQELQDLAANLGVADIVRFRGWQPRDVVLDELRHAHIVINASVTAANGDAEGIPNTLKEAMACGIPVIATRHSGIPELVEDGESGYLVAERDVDALAARVARLGQEPHRWADMGKAGRAGIEDHYDIQRLNDRLVELYREVVNKHLVGANDGNRTINAGVKAIADVR